MKGFLKDVKNIGNYDIKESNFYKGLKEEFTFWQEGMAQSDDEYFNITSEEIDETIQRTIDDEEFTQVMHNCFDYYLNHYRKEEKWYEKKIFKRHDKRGTRTDFKM